MRHASRTLGAVMALWSVCPAFPVTATLAADSLWMHNGSLMYYQAQGKYRIFIYLEPRPGLEHLRGQVLFNGRMENGRLKGTAATFRKGCPPELYTVRGGATGEGGLELAGAAPVRAQGNCRTKGYDWHTPNSRLVFSYVARVPPESAFTAWEAPEIAYFHSVHSLRSGEVIVRASDPGEPAWRPVLVKVLLQCASRRQRELARYRVCDIRGSELTDDGLLLVRLVRYDPEKNECSIERTTRIHLEDACLTGRNR